MVKTVLLFPGQGSQYVGMGKELCERSSIARQTFEEANEAIGFDLQKVCFEGSMEELTKTMNAQPAILTTSVAAYRVYMQEYAITPKFAAGHSLGEFSALTCADGIKFSDAVKIVNQRGKIMQESVSIGSGAMSAISGVDVQIIIEECNKISTSDNIVTISNFNSPDQTVISGHKLAVQALGEALGKMGARVIPLKVSAPFHCPLMKPAAEKFKEELIKYSYNPLKIPVISNVTAIPYSSHESIIENLTNQIVEPVQWKNSMEFVKGQGIDVAIEIGPQTVLRNLMKKNAKDIKAFSFDKYEDIKAFEEIINGGNANNQMRNDNTTVITKCLATAICTRNKNWNDDEYQKGVVEPYRNIQSIQEQIDKENRNPTVEEMKVALEMLKTVFVTKKLPIDEQIELFNELFDETNSKHLFPDFIVSSL